MATTECCRTFTWVEARWLEEMPGGFLNVAYEAVGRHASAGLADQVALRCLDRDRRSTQERRCEEFPEPNGEQFIATPLMMAKT